MVMSQPDMTDHAARYTNVDPVGDPARIGGSLADTVPESVRSGSFDIRKPKNQYTNSGRDYRLLQVTVGHVVHKDEPRFDNS